MLSDICSVQGVKRVICHLIENLCVAETENRKTRFPFPSRARSLAVCTRRGDWRNISVPVHFARLCVSPVPLCHLSHMQL